MYLHIFLLSISKLENLKKTLHETYILALKGTFACLSLLLVKTLAWCNMLKIVMLFESLIKSLLT